METARETPTPIGDGLEEEFVTITIAETGETFRCRTQESLLESMRRLGKRGVPIGCRSGGCSVCKIEILSGAYARTRPMSREYISDEDLAADRVLACCVRPLGDIALRAIGKMRKAIMRPSEAQQ
jgi:ferredoxin